MNLWRRLNSFFKKRHPVSNSIVPGTPGIHTSLPEGSEKTCVELIKYLKKEPCYDLKYLQCECSNLKSQLEEEKLYCSRAKCCSPKNNFRADEKLNLVECNLQNLYDENQRNQLLKLKVEDMKNRVLHYLESLLKDHIQILDIKEIFNLVKKVSKNIDEIEGKDVVLFYGHTDVGKSTTVNYLGGAKMRRGKDGKIYVKEGQKMPIAQIGQSFINSETCLLKNFPIDHKTLAKLLGRGINIVELNLCDFPGYNDTNGIEAEIANHIGINIAKNKCKSMKFVAFLPLPAAYQLRFKITVELCDKLSNIFTPEFEKHLNDSCLILFTKSLQSKQEIFDIYKTAHDEYKLKNEGGNVVSLVKRVLGLMENVDYHLVNPLEKNTRASFLQQIIDLKSIDVKDLNFSIPREVYSAIIEFFELKTEHLKVLLNINDIEQVHHILNQIEKLKNMMFNAELLEKNYKETCELIAKIFGQKMDEEINKFKANELEMESLARFAEFYNIVERFEQCKYCHLKEFDAFLIDKEFFKKTLEDKATNLFNVLKQTNLEDPRFNKLSELMEFLVSKFQFCKPFQKKLFEAKQEKFGKMAPFFADQSDTMDIKMVVEGYKRQKNWRKVSNDDSFDEPLRKMKEALLEKIKELKINIMKISHILGKGLSNYSDDFLFIEKTLENIKIFQKDEELDVDSSLAEDLIKSFLKEIEDFYRKTLQEISEISSENKLNLITMDNYREIWNEFGRLKGKLEMVSGLQNILPLIESQTSYEILDQSKKFYREYINIIVSIFMKKGECFDEEIFVFLEEISKVNWISPLVSDFDASAQAMRENMENFLLTQLSLIKSNLNKNKKIAEEFSLIMKNFVQPIVKLFSQNMKFQEKYPKIMNKIKDFQNGFEQILEQDLKEAKNFKSNVLDKALLEKKDLNVLEKHLNFLQSFKKSKTLTEELTKKLETLFNQIKEYLQIVLKNQVLASINKILDSVLSNKYQDSDISLLLRNCLILNTTKEECPIFCKYFSSEEESLRKIFVDFSNKLQRNLEFAEDSAESVKLLNKLHCFYQMFEGGDQICENLLKMCRLSQTEKDVNAHLKKQELKEIRKILETQYTDYKNQVGLRAFEKSLINIFSRIKFHWDDIVRNTLSMFENAEFDFDSDKIQFLSKIHEVFKYFKKAEEIFIKWGTLEEAATRYVKELNEMLPEMARRFFQRAFDNIEDELLKSYNFVKWQAKLNKVRDSFPQIEILGVSTNNLQILVKEKEEKRDQQIKKLHEKFNSMELRDFSLVETKKILEQFTKIEKEKLFETDFSKFINIIKDKIKDAVTKISETVTNFTDFQSSFLSICNSDYENALGDLFKYLLEQIKKVKEINQENLNQFNLLTSNNNPDTVINQEEIISFVQKTLPKCKPLGLKFLEFFRFKCNECMKIIEDFDNKRIKKKTLNWFEPFEEKSLEFENEIGFELKKINTFLIRELKDFFAKFMCEFGKPDDGTLESKKVLSKVSLKAKFVLEIQKQYESMIKKLLKPSKIWVDYGDLIKDFFGNLKEKLKENQNCFIVIPNEFFQLKTPLKLLQSQQTLLAKFKKEMFFLKKSQLSELQDFASDLENSLNFEKAVECIKPKIKEIIDFIGQEDFLKLKLEDEKKKRLNEIQQQKSELNSFSRDFRQFSELETAFDQMIYGKIEDFHTKTMNLLQQRNFFETSLTAFNDNRQTLEAFFKYYEKNPIVKKYLDEIDKKFGNMFSELQEKAGKAIGNEADFQIQLISLKRISIDVLSRANDANQTIDVLLQRFKDQNSKIGGNKMISFIKSLGEDRYGKMILNGHKFFEMFQNYFWNSRISKKEFNKVIQEFEADGDIRKDALLNFLDKCNKKYQNLIDEVLKHLINSNDVKDEVNTLVNKLFYLLRTLAVDGKYFRKVAFSFFNTCDSFCWNDGIKEALHEIIAYIFAIWTIMNSHAFCEQDKKEKDQNKEFLFQPNPVQIISIARIFGCDSESKDIDNHLVQIGTGEGKSIILAVISCIMALFGCQVSCACYSETLSKRDYEAFKLLFEKLNVIDKIKYGTFNKLCENLINQEADIRELVKNQITNKGKKVPIKKLDTDLYDVLLIDEIDVFTSSEFFGKTYSPVVSINHPFIKDILEYIWKNRSNKDNLQLERIRNQPSYLKCRNQCFQNHSQLLENAISQMVYDVDSFENHGYEVCNGKIGYPEMDKINFTRIVGYKTYFAYLYEIEKNAAVNRDQNLEKLEGVSIKCGNFSNAHVAKRFNFLMGVTGTLKTMSPLLKQEINNMYNIKRFTYAPSVFDKKKVNFDPEKDFSVPEKDISVFPPKTCLEVLTEEIIKIRKVKNDNPVIVVFESEDPLNLFRNSRISDPVRADCNYLFENMIDEEQRKQIITKATNKGQITLITRQFGRGTDFAVRDSEVSRDGGVHIIITFIPKDEAEEIQIIGRTARQGEPGSYSIVVINNDWEYFGITENDFKTIPKKIIVEKIGKKRVELYDDEYIKIVQRIKGAELAHDKSIEFQKELLKGNDVSGFLIEQNPFIGMLKKVWKTVVLMDATGSMGPFISKAKAKVHEMFKRARNVLKEKRRDPNCFSLQFVAYRNYNADEKTLLENSPFETSPDNLLEFLNKIEPKFGWENEAIEVAFWHANQIREEIDQIILIGDKPANTWDEVKSKRQKRGEYYWGNTSKFTQPVYYQDELKKLQDRKVKIHAFYVNVVAKSCFEEISYKTGGKSKFLDVNSEKGEIFLTDLVTTEILTAIDPNLGKEYYEIYMKNNKAYVN